jgi:hypothetical protein
VKVGLLTTWNTQCGIAEYSRALADALRRRDDVELVVLGSRNYDERWVAESEDYVVPCFDVPAWNRYGHSDLDVERILGLDLDVLHVQYQMLLYDRPRLDELLERFNGVRVVTWHDKCIAPEFDWRRFDVALRHRPDVGPSGHVVPFGIRDLPAVVRTFGLGRTREDLIAPICERHGWVFESAASSEAALPDHRWRPWRELHDWLRGADAIVLWYADNALAGSSQAARTAIATRRPVIVNDVTWFADLPARAGAFRKIPDDPAALEATLRELLGADGLISAAAWDTVAACHVERYRGTEGGACTAAEPASAGAPPSRGSTRVSVAQWLEGDLGHLHRAGDLSVVPIASHRRIAGPGVRWAKRTTRRLLFPLIDIQAGWNGASARVATFLMSQLAEQAERIDELERQAEAQRAQRWSAGQDR